MLSLNEKTYHGRQLFRWIYNVSQRDFDCMTDLSASLRETLKDRFCVTGLDLQKRVESSDGTVKYLFRMSDGLPVETVLIPEADRKTVCVSSQAGCALACGFCATGTMGLQRDLSVGEIVGQLLFLRETYGIQAFSNVVFMGMGEPLNNYSNLVASIRIMTSPEGLNISPRRITISTSGVTPKIRRLIKEGLKTGLAISLHAANQADREKIMPVAKTFGLDGLMSAIREYTAATRLAVTFEFILFKGVNDTVENAKQLGRLVRGIRCKINVLGYNPVAGLPFERPSDVAVNQFARELSRHVRAVTVRTSRGLDINAACGQLAAKNSMEE